MKQTAKCEAAEPSTKAIKLFDGRGGVSPTGANKSWRLAYRVDGRPQTIGFGTYPEVSLAAARTKRDEVKSTLREGNDPISSRRVSRDDMILEEASAQYWAGRRDLSESYRANAEHGTVLHLAANGFTGNIYCFL